MHPVQMRWQPTEPILRCRKYSAEGVWGGLGECGVRGVEAVLAVHGLPTRLRAPLAVADLQAAMARDKKVRAGGLRFVVLHSLGVAATQAGIDPALAAASLAEVGAV